MRRALSLALLSLAIAAPPARAEERAAEVNIPAGTAGDAIRALGRQQRVSVGFRDRRIAGLRLNAVRGRLTATQALQRLLVGTGAYARRVAPSSYVIEALPRPVGVARRAPPRAAPAPSQPGAQLVVADIVVTATKRDVPLADYPGGAQVIAGDSLSLGDGARGTGLIEARAASVTSTHLGPGRNKLFIRGIADSSFVGPTQATVGQYWGNSRITYSAPDPSLRLYDVKSIEVLEGPQGTLYGAGSLGGVVRVVPNAPDLHRFGGSLWGGVQAVQHGDSGYDGGAILNVPIADDRVGLRLLGFSGIDGGYIDNRDFGPTGVQDVNRVRTYGGRGALRIDPGGDWMVDLSVLWQLIEGSDAQYADRKGNGLSRSSTIAQPFKNEYRLTDIAVAKRWNQLEFSASLAYAWQQVGEKFEGPRPLPDDYIGVPPTNSISLYSQDNTISMLMGEARLSSRGPDGAGWLAGVSVLHNKGDVFRYFIGTRSAPGVALTGVRNRVEEATLYGEYTQRLTDRLSLTGGGRLTRSRLSGQATAVDALFALRVNPDAADTRVETRLLPSVALGYRLSEPLTLFARYQEGFRPGGISVQKDYIQQFEGDRVSTAEAGARYSSDSFDASLTASWSRWRNIQADIVDGAGFPTTANIGDGRVLSLGGMGKWRPVDGLELEAALYLNDSRLSQPDTVTLPFAAGVAVDRSRLPNVAGKSGRLGVNYTAPVNDRDRLDLRGYVRYIGRSTLGIGSILGREQGNYTDTGLELRLGDARRGVSVTATNLLDTRGNRFALGSPFLVRDEQQITPLQPRSVRLGFDVAF